MWGLYHGLLLLVYRLFQVFKHKKPDKEEQGFNLRRIFKIVIFFHLICISWLLFRAESIGQASNMLLKIFTDLSFTDFVGYGLVSIAFYIIPLLMLEYWTERTGNLLVLLDSRLIVQVLVYLYFIMMLIIFPPLVSQEFIYFQF